MCNSKGIRTESTRFLRTLTQAISHSHLALAQTRFVPFQKAAENEKREVDSIDIGPGNRFVSVHA